MEGLVMVLPDGERTDSSLPIAVVQVFQHLNPLSPEERVRALKALGQLFGIHLVVVDEGAREFDRLVGDRLHRIYSNIVLKEK